MGRLAEFASNHPFHVLSVAVALIAVVFYEIRLRNRGFAQVSANDAVKLINQGALVIDVRSPQEYQSGHILNAKNIQLETLEADPAAVKKRKDKPILAVCDNGMKSGRAAHLLRRSGFEQAYAMKAGLSSWHAENLPLVK